jgi:cell surface protein SprA
LALCVTANAQTTTQQDTVKTGVSLGKLQLKNPSSIVSKYTYDPVLDRYIYTEKVGNFNINYPLILTPEQYYKLVQKEQMKKYFKDKLDAFSGRKEGAEEARKNLLPNFYVNSNFFESIFGGNTIEVIPTGSVAMDLGVRIQKNDNPSLSPRNRTNVTFDFDQRIQLSLLGKVGTRLAVTANYNTEATFDFQQVLKLDYTPDEDDIIQKIEVGNVSMPLNSSLIQGAQSLFGVKTQLQFGNTTVTGVFSEQRSQNNRVTAQGGGTLDDFEMLALDYDEDRHYFLSHYFRDNYDQALENYPWIRSQIQITRIEVWVTNRGQRTDNVRNVVAIQDLGETAPDDTRINQSAPPGFFNIGLAAPPRNDANDYNPLEIGTANSVLTETIRDVATAQSGFNVPGYTVNQGFDYAILENARKLEEVRDYTLDTQLGYISLNQRLSNDEVLAVAYQYTVNGEVFQVGEFANDGVNATDFQQGPGGQIIEVNNQALVLKLLKSNITNVSDPIWDLMMKNIYSTGAFQLSQEDFKLNILYTDPSPLNYITPVDENTWPAGLDERILLDVFNFDRLNIYNDAQNGGDGFFDFLPGITVDQQNGRIIFTKVEPFGEHLYDVLGGGADYDNDITYLQNSNANQLKYVFRNLYKQTKAAALQDSDKNKFQLKGRYKSEGSSGIPLGAFNVPRGSVQVRAGGRILQEGIDYTVNYVGGTVQILDEGLRNSNIPIEVSVENNAIFGQQTRRFSGVDVEHKFSDKFLMGATYLNMSERPLTQKANYGLESVNNSIFGVRANYATEVPFFTRLVNKLPNIDTDVASNLSVRGEFAYLKPGSPKSADFGGETTVYLDDFEGAQSLIDVRSPLAWTLASPPLEFTQGLQLQDPADPQNLQFGYNRSKLAWYTIDPIFYSNQRPGGISNNDISLNETRRIFIDEIFPQADIAQGQTTVQNTLDLAYYPNLKGPYNNNTDSNFNALPEEERWGGIMRSISSTNFEQSNVEFIQFWVLDPYYQDGVLPGTGGELVFNLGNISEDILTDGRKQYENGLPGTNPTEIVTQTSWGQTPSSQSLVYAFDADATNRGLQDVGFDGIGDADEASIYTNNSNTDPALDNYVYYLNREGGILERYLDYNNPDGNSPTTVTNTNRGSTTLPDVEDVNRDLTMNTINSYFEYRIPIRPNIQITDKFVSDIRRQIIPKTPNNDQYEVRWIQFKIPINPNSYNLNDPEDDAAFSAIGGINDLRSISLMRMYMTGFNTNTVLRFGTLDLVRGDWRQYTNTLKTDLSEPGQGTFVDVNTVNILENEQREPIPYKLPPGVRREQLNTNNTIVRQNEQSLSFAVCELEPEDARGVFKNVNIDIRQYKKLKMFLHAEALNNVPVSDNELVGFIRIGTDFNENFYQIEIPLQITPPGTTSPDAIWPSLNEINLELALLSKVKAASIAAQSLTQLTYYDEELNPVNEFDIREAGKLRIGIKGNPSLGNVRSVMVGVKNPYASTAIDAQNVCGEVWFNELRLAELDNKGGWAAISAIDANFADFADISATGRMSTAGFGAIDQIPNERSREDVVQYDVVTNVNLGQLLPQKWGMQIPFNYSHSEQKITPEFDPLYQDLKLDDRLNAATTQEEKQKIKTQAEDYTKRQSINFIGVRKNRSPEKKPRFYDVENFTFNYSYNETNHRDFEVEQLQDQNVKTGVVYSYNFRPVYLEPFKKSDSLLRGKYWQWLKDLNFNPLPTSVSVNSNIIRGFNRQRFREVFIDGVDPNQQLQLPELQQRNFLFDWQYAINYNLTRSLRLNFTASNYNIVKNYLDENDAIREDFGIWDGFWNTGDPNRHTQQLQLNYEIPFDKVLPLSFINADYTYTGDFDWQRGSDVLIDIANEEINTVQNANTHSLNAGFNMDKLYGLLGIKQTKGNVRPQRPTVRRAPNQNQNTAQAGNTKKKNGGFGKAALDVLTMVKRMNVTYTENNGKVLPGYTRSIGFIGTLKPSFGFVFGSQSDIRFEAAKRGWLTQFPEFNQQFQQVHNTTLNITANAEPFRDLTIDLDANRQYSERYTENFTVNNNGGVLEYENLLGNQFGDFSISTLMIGTAFKKSDENFSEVFEEFKANRIVIAQRLAGQPIDPNATTFPTGYSETSQQVLLPALLAAYSGQKAENVKLGAFRDVPIPNWNVKYTGLMRNDWFRKKFNRFSLAHGYRSSYSINGFRTNLDYDPNNPLAVNQQGDYKAQTLFTNVTLTEQFNPLMRVDFEMKNSINVLAEVSTDRTLVMSFDNNLLTEMSGKEYKLGLGYRIKDVSFTTNIGGKKSILKGDVNLKADLSLRDNLTVIRNLDINTNQVTSGQKLWSLKFTASYALTKNLETLFFYDHAFSKFAVSTAFPQTTIRSGFTVKYNFGN